MEKQFSLKSDKVMFIRYEIRWLFHRCFYEGGDTFEYIPFDTLKDAENYIIENKNKLHNNDADFVGLYKVGLFSNYDVPQLIRKL